MTRDEIRYPLDPPDANRIIYENGQYWRIRESFFDGGLPWTIPTHRFRFSPFSPFDFHHRLAHPIPGNMNYWSDLDLKYHLMLRDKLRYFYTHYSLSDEDKAMVDGLMSMPIGSTITLKTIATCTINFPDESMNYSVDLEEDKVYRIDYVEDAVLKTGIGKLVKVSNHNGLDYKGAKLVYTIVYLDCSSDFENDVRKIDSRDIRYIKSLSDLQTNTVVIRTYVGASEPDHNNFGGWFDTTCGQYKMYDYVNKTWVLAPSQPTESAGDGCEWVYSKEKKAWVIIDIPELTIPDDDNEYVLEGGTLEVDDTKTNVYKLVDPVLRAKTENDVIPEKPDTKYYIIYHTEYGWIRYIVKEPINTGENVGLDTGIYISGDTTNEKDGTADVTIKAPTI